MSRSSFEPGVSRPAPSRTEAQDGGPSALAIWPPDASPVWGRVPRARQEAVLPDPTIGYLAAGGLPLAVLARASEDARRLDVSADAALLATGTVGEDDVYRALARHVGAAFVTGGVRIAPGTDYAAAATAGIAPLQRWPGGPRWLIAPRGAAIRALIAAASDRHTLVVTSPRRFEALLRQCCAERVAADAATTLEIAAPGQSAAHLMSPAFLPTMAGLVMVATLALWLNRGWAVASVGVVLWVSFAVACAQRISAAFASLEVPPPVRPLPDRDLPTYTVVVALYREAAMSGEIVTALERLDYPRAKLDVHFVVEQDDVGTLRALAARIGDLRYDIIVAPGGHPRTKPRALNIALPFVRGTLLTVYDAEDRPAPNQLRMAAAQFARAPADVACLQARLAIDNADDGWLQALYAIDYAALFGVFNPGLGRMGLPIFLGGSSNHLRTDLLKAAGGWDAWNVTEDADLGVRLARRGFAVATFDSDTGEEAPMTARALLSQRVRWKKGWMQTLIVHVRAPGALWRDLGPRRFVAVLALFAAGLLGRCFGRSLPSRSAGTHSPAICSVRPARWPPSARR